MKAHPAQRVPAALLLAAVLLRRGLCRGLLLLLLRAHHVLRICMRLEGLRLWLQVEALQLSCCLQAVSPHKQVQHFGIGGPAEDLQEATMHVSERALLPWEGLWQALKWFSSGARTGHGRSAAPEDIFNVQTTSLDTTLKWRRRPSNCHHLTRPEKCTQWTATEREQSCIHLAASNSACMDLVMAECTHLLNSARCSIL